MSEVANAVRKDGHGWLGFNLLDDQDRRLFPIRLEANG